MLSREYRTIFIHIPKTGGQSVERVFLQAHGLKWEERAPLLLRPNADPSRGPGRLAHLYAREYVAHGHISAEDFGAFFKFAVVRNPWARVVSTYKYKGKSSGHEFRPFIRDLFGWARRTMETRQVDPQVKYVRGAVSGLLVDRLLRFENLEKEFAEVSRKVFGREVPLPISNVSPDRTDYREFFDDETTELVARMYADDIEAFGYKFDDSA